MDPILDHFEKESKAWQLPKRKTVIKLVVFLCIINPLLITFWFDGKIEDYFINVVAFWIFGFVGFFFSYLILIVLGSIIGAFLDDLGLEKHSKPFNHFVEYFKIESILFWLNLLLLLVILILILK